MINKERVSIYLAVPGDKNVIKKEPEKILKYKELIIEILRVLNVKAELIPVIIGAIGTISKSLKQYLRIVIISKNTRHST